MIVRVTGNGAWKCEVFQGERSVDDTEIPAGKKLIMTGGHGNASCGAVPFIKFGNWSPPMLWACSIAKEKEKK